jgi:hypothetical protein
MRRLKRGRPGRYGLRSLLKKCQGLWWVCTFLVYGALPDRVSGMAVPNVSSYAYRGVHEISKQRRQCEEEDRKNPVRVCTHGAFVGLVAMGWEYDPG